MGMFSYACTKCGGKSQFDWASQCVVKIGYVYARGRYDGYGSVKIALKGSAKTVVAYPKQFLDIGVADAKSGDLLATDIYCDGDGKKQSTSQEDVMKQMAQAQAAMLQGLMGGGEDLSSDDESGGYNRHCVPKGIVILDALDESMLELLPEPAKAKTAKASGITKDDEAPKKKKAKSAKF